MKRFCSILFAAGMLAACATDTATSSAQTAPEGSPVIEAFEGTSEARGNIDPYPSQIGNKTRRVIYLPPQDDESLFRVELFAGQMMETDGVNQVGFRQMLREVTLQGWGFPYWEIDPLNAPMSTLIGVAPGTPSVQKFVRTPGLLVRYNSRLPLVVYAPEDVEIRYRVYSGSKAMDVPRQ